MWVKLRPTKDDKIKIPEKNKSDDKDVEYSMSKIKTDYQLKGTGRARHETKSKLRNLLLFQHVLL